MCSPSKIDFRPSVGVDIAYKDKGEQSEENMGIFGVSNSSSLASNALSKSGQTSDTSSSEDSTVQEFEAFLKETPAERMADTWLQAHHITKAEFKAMSPEQQAAIKQQMATDIQNEIKRKVEQSTSALT